MKKTSSVVSLLVALTTGAHAQSLFTPGSSNPGFYVGGEGGLNWLLNSRGNGFDTGYAVGGKVGYDFVGPRVEFETLYRSNTAHGLVPSPSGLVPGQGEINQLSTMVNGLYDFFPGAKITPYVGAGIGLAFVDPAIVSCSLCSTQLAYQGIVGIGYNVAPNWRLDLDGRYYGTTDPGTYSNNDFSVMLGVTYKFGR